MRDLLLCISFFELTFIVLSADEGRTEEIKVNHEAYKLMECEPFYGTDDLNVRAAAECSFGGYYPGGPSTQL